MTAGVPIVQATCNIAPFRKIPITALMDSAKMPKYKIVQTYCLYIIGTDALLGDALSARIHFRGVHFRGIHFPGMHFRGMRFRNGYTYA